MEVLITENFIVRYASEIKNFIIKTVEHANNKKHQFCKIFNCSISDVERLNASFFVDRTEFENHIKEIANGQTPPSWATGCFYNGEIQVLVDLKKTEEKMNTLAHELLHLFFEKMIYQKYNIERVNWLDESFAVYLDGGAHDFDSELEKSIKYLSKISKGFDMNILCDYNIIKTKEYDGYDMFNIIGKYIFETKQENKFLNMLVEDRNKLVELGKHILQDTIDYFKEKIIFEAGLK